MYDNIGGKIKGLAKFCACVCSIGGILIAIIGYANYVAEADSLKYAAVYGGSNHDSLMEAGDKAYLGLQMLKYGLIVAVTGFAGSWPLYGFGELIEKVCRIEQNICNGGASYAFQQKITPNIPQQRGMTPNVPQQHGITPNVPQQQEMMPNISQQYEVSERINKINRLREQGLITEAEYQDIIAKKRGEI